MAAAVSHARLARQLSRQKPRRLSFLLPPLRGGFEVEFERSMTIAAGENCREKSTFLEGIVASRAQHIRLRTRSK
jgi:predicted ATPase